jgi:hypothetical protein
LHYPTFTREFTAFPDSLPEKFAPYCDTVRYVSVDPDGDIRLSTCHGDYRATRTDGKLNCDTKPFHPIWDELDDPHAGKVLLESGEWVDEDDAIYVDGRGYYLAENVSTCDGCDGQILTTHDTYYHVHRQGIYCDDCVSVH